MLLDDDALYIIYSMNFLITLLSCFNVLGKTGIFTVIFTQNALDFKGPVHSLVVVFNR